MTIQASQEIEKQLVRIERKMSIELGKRTSLIKDLHPSQILSAQNLICYLTLRNQDIRALQDLLHVHGLSSLTSSESHIRRQIQSILERLGRRYKPEDIDACNYQFSREKIGQTSKVLFGKQPDPTIPYLMVTFDTSFATNYGLIKALLQNGMNVARINCSHDDEATWSRMIAHLKTACRSTGLDCKIYMDLAGPKIRTKLLTKGRRKGKIDVREGDVIWLAEEVDFFLRGKVVVSPGENGIIKQLKEGIRVYIDDGIIRGVIEKIRSGAAAMRIDRVASEKNQIRESKGMNFPDVDISVPSLTDFDKACLPFICEHADLVGYSFVRQASDVANLQQLLATYSSDPPHIILKIETPKSVKNLPSLLLQGMKQEAFGVMIARGDLAVEIGFERMGEIQEEILWISEAAHAPVVWATQVLESLNKFGMVTRAEVTDAAHATLAECVMVNKGSHTVEVIQTLRDICSRIGGHHVKKRFSFRPLSIANEFIKGGKLSAFPGSV